MLANLEVSLTGLFLLTGARLHMGDFLGTTVRTAPQGSTGSRAWATYKTRQEVLCSWGSIGQGWGLSLASWGRRDVSFENIRTPWALATPPF